MKTRLMIAVTATAALTALAAFESPAFAHHSFAAEFDADKPITLTGGVTKIEWTNPHTYFYIDVIDEKTGRSPAGDSRWAAPTA